MLATARTSLRWLRPLQTPIPLRPSTVSSCARSYATTPFVVSGKLNRFPLGISHFGKIRKTPGLAYFDKTAFITQTLPYDVALLCRPRRFGKSHLVSMLEHFHGVDKQYDYERLFKGLYVDRAVRDKGIDAGKYLIMKFNFSNFETSDVDTTTENLKSYIFETLDQFVYIYAPYLGDSFMSRASRSAATDPVGHLRMLVARIAGEITLIKEQGKKDHPLFNVNGIYFLVDEYDALAFDYMKPHDPGSWTETKLASLFEGFWSIVKSGTELENGIDKVFITGVTPLLLAGMGSGFNIATNVSFKPAFSTVCGLTESDVLGALRHVYNDEEKVQQSLTELRDYVNGYHFCYGQPGPTVFNTYTAMDYLQSALIGEKPNLADPPNSEVSESFLETCASSPAAVQYIQSALQKDEDGNFCKLPYRKLAEKFKLEELSMQARGEGGAPAWLSLMIYMGGLTFDQTEPSKFLRIPNRVAAERFGTALLKRLGLYASMTQAVSFLSSTGDLKKVLSGYFHLMKQRDGVPYATKITEQYHRDSLWAVILDNPGLTPSAEYQVSKSTTNIGGVDLLIESKDWYTVVEFKYLDINFLNLKGSTKKHKAKKLSLMCLEDIIQLEFNKSEKFRSGTIERWMDTKVCTQLQEYVTGPTVQKNSAGKKFRAYAVVIIGTYKILIREMDCSGGSVGGWQLVPDIDRKGHLTDVE